MKSKSSQKQYDQYTREMLLEEIKDLQDKHEELENLLIECKRAIDANKDLGSLLEVAQDLSVFKRAEEDLKKERDYFKNVLDNSADAIGIVDSRGRFIRWNKRAEELFGYSFKELKGKSAFDLYADKVALDLMLAELREKGYVRDYEIDIRRKDGKILPFGMSISVLQEEGRNIGSVCVARDLSQIKLVQKKLRKSKEAAESANKAKSDFLANMSHEIRTPLNAILGFSEILLNQSKDNLQKRYLQTILSSGQTLLTLIDDILDMSKIEAGKMEIRPEPLDLEHLLREVQIIFQHKIKEKGLEFFLDVSPDLPRRLLLDEVRSRQILINLIGNAVKFTKQGWVKVTVWTVNQTGDKVDLFMQVEDTGVGIPESQHGIIFENFRQRDNQRTREYGGSGLGLAITKKLVDMMQGKIHLESKENKGSRFCIHVPAVPRVDKKEIVSEHRVVYREIHFVPHRIMVLDDIVSNIDLIKEYLKDTGLEVVGVTSVSAALDLIRQDPPHLILLDILMPEKNGYLVAEAIRSDPDLPEIPLIAFTATVLKNDLQRISQDFQGYLPKPVKREALIEELKRFLPVSHEYIPELDKAKKQEQNNVAKTDSGPGPEDGNSENQRRIYAKFFPRIKELKNVIIMDEIEALVQEMDNEARRLGDDRLLNYSGQLFQYVRSYDVGGLSYLLHRFSEFLGVMPGEQTK